MFRFVCVFLLILFSSPVLAAIGTVTQISGSGVIERDKSVVGGKVGTSVEQMDVAVTQSGKMRIDFIDDTRVDVIDHSRLIIDEFVYDPNTGKGSLSIKASLGAVRYASGQIAKNSRQNVKVRTPSATISVRGTDFNMVVDEIGGSYVTLLPSCDASGACVTGEIRVENDAGFVIMNQAFQMTKVSTTKSAPTPPIVVDLSEAQMNGLLIVRRTDPIVEAQERSDAEARKNDFLNIDYLKFDDLDQDALVDDIKEIWVTELDKGADFYLRELLVNMIDQLNAALMEMFSDELKKQNEEFFAVKTEGYDEKTGYWLYDQDPNWKLTRTDASTKNNLDLSLNKNSGYTINLEQGDEAVYDYRIGVGSNVIDIKQRQ